MQIQGNVFLVTGASSGIGLATVRALAARKGKVAMLARSFDVLSDLASEIPDSLAIEADMTNHESIQKAVERAHRHYGKLNGLINNAGRSYSAQIEEVDASTFEEIFRLNVLGPIVAMQAVIPIMREQGGGSIVNVNSGTSFMVIPGYSVYSSSKRALAGFSAAAREELVGDGIVVSEVYPGVTATNFGKNRMTVKEGPPADYSHGQPAEEVAEYIIRAIEEGGANYFTTDFIAELSRKAAADPHLVHLPSTRKD